MSWFDRDRFDFESEGTTGSTTNSTTASDDLTTTNEEEEMDSPIKQRGEKRKRLIISDEEEEKEEQDYQDKNLAHEPEKRRRRSQRLNRIESSPSSPVSPSPIPSPRRTRSRSSPYEFRSRSDAHLAHVDEMLNEMKEERQKQQQRQQQLEKERPLNTESQHVSDNNNDDADDDSGAAAVVEDEYEDEDDESWIVNDDDDDNGSLLMNNDASSHVRLDNERLRSAEDEEVEADTLTAVQVRLELSLPTALDMWCKYLCTVLVDADFSQWCYDHKAIRSRLLPAIQMVEEKFESKRTLWVKSSLWEQSTRQHFYVSLMSLPYMNSNYLTAEDRIDAETGRPLIGGGAHECQICNGSHAATHRIKLFGIPYQRQHLTHPFHPKLIFKHYNYETQEFTVGELCHQRLKLFHAMTHFKLRVMLDLRSLLDKLHAKTKNVIYNTQLIQHMFPNKQQQQQQTPPSTLSALDVAAAPLLTRSLLSHYSEIYDFLLTMADKYSSSDSRTVRIDLRRLDEAQHFESEACASTLFNLRQEHDIERQIEEEADATTNTNRPVKSKKKQRDEEPEEEIFDSDDNEQLDHGSINEENNDGDSACIDTASDLSRPRRLLMQQVARSLTRGEMQYLFSLLGRKEQKWWKQM